jgi:hypothetical protein
MESVLTLSRNVAASVKQTSLPNATAPATNAKPQDFRANLRNITVNLNR